MEKYGYSQGLAYHYFCTWVVHCFWDEAYRSVL